MFICCPFGNVMSPGCCPSLQAPTCLPSMIVTESRGVPLSGGSKAARASVRYAVSPVIVVTELVCTFVTPRSQTASIVTLLPATLRLCLLHMPAIIPIDIRYTYCCTESSRQRVETCGCCFVRPTVVVVVDHS